MIAQDIAQTIVDPRPTPTASASTRPSHGCAGRRPWTQAQPEGFDPFWVVTRHADILEVERQNDLFHNGDRSPIADHHRGRPEGPRDDGRQPAPGALPGADGQARPHGNYRRLTQAWFVPQNLRALEDRIREIARGFVDRMAAHGGRCDFARDVAFLYPLHVIMEVLGVPEADEPRMLKLTQELFGSADPELNRTGQGRSTTPTQALDNLQAVVIDFIDLLQRHDRGPPRQSARRPGQRDRQRHRSTASRSATSRR